MSHTTSIFANMSWCKCAYMSWSPYATRALHFQFFFVEEYWLQENIHASNWFPDTFTPMYENMWEEVKSKTVQTILFCLNDSQITEKTTNLCFGEGCIYSYTQPDGLQCMFHPSLRSSAIYQCVPSSFLIKLFKGNTNLFDHMSWPCICKVFTSRFLSAFSKAMFGFYTIETKWKKSCLNIGHP